jgi:hypothetical protein
MTKSRKNSDAESWVLFGAMVFISWVLWFGWGVIRDYSGWFSHNTITMILANTPRWSVGEYRTCSERNLATMEDEPLIECYDFKGGLEAKQFNVRFYGSTFSRELEGKANFTWRCRRNEGADPAFTCDDRKPLSSSSANNDGAPDASKFDDPQAYKEAYKAYLRSGGK